MMANPVPSDKIVDFKSNSETLDEVVNSNSETVNTRTGKTISTHTGWQSQVDELIQQGQIDIDKAIRDAGYQKVGTFESGATLTDFNQALEWAVADGGDGNWYRWDGAYNKVVPASSTPAGTGGVGAGAWINVTDLTLRSELPKLTALGGNAVFKQVSDLVSMTTKDGQLDATTLEAMRVAGTRYKVESFYGDGASDSFEHFLLNGADKSAQGYDGTDGYAAFQIDLGGDALDLWSCLLFQDSMAIESVGGNLDTFLLLSQDNRVESAIKNNITGLNSAAIAKSVNIKGLSKDKGDKTTLEFITGQDGLLITKTFVGGADENIIGISIRDLKIKEQTLSKTIGKSGLLINRVNKDLDIRSIDVIGFEKGIHLKGVIGGNLYKVEATSNKYGLYSESNNDAGLPAYDATNTHFYGGVFNANEVGAYLGAITQGFNFYGTNIERNTVSGLDIASTPPAGSVISFFGGWFEANPIAVRFIQKPKTVSFNSVYFFDNTNLWDNNGSGNIDAKFERCKIESSHINLDIFEGSFIDNDCVNCTFTASSPTAYQCAEWRGTSVLVDDGNTLLSTRRIGNGRYQVEALGDPQNTALSDGSLWLDCSDSTLYVRKDSTWYRYEKYLIDQRTADLPNVVAGGSAAYGPYTLSGAAVGDFVEVFLNIDKQGLILEPYVNATNQITINLYNNTSGDINLTSALLRTKVLK